MMKPEVLHPKALKKEIDRKYGGLSRFGRLSGLNRYEVQKILVRKYPTLADLQMIKKAILNTPANGHDPEAVTKELVARLNEAIKRHGGVQSFCRLFPEYQPHDGTIYSTLRGERKIITPFFRSLCETLKVKI